jgi:hypothetical protein
MPTVHFHLKNTPITARTQGRHTRNESREKDTVLCWYALRFPEEGRLARYILRKYAGGAR